MGFFGKLFDKKECDLCGGEIGLLGNRKLEDGNMCKDCAKKLSPWFSDRKKSTVEEIRAQLAYREENKKEVETFHVTRVLGRNYMVCLDEDAGKFLVAEGKNFREDNPDVLSFTQVTGCDLDVEEDQDEITYTNSQGEEESYRPPRYRYRYDFYMVIRVDHPYFDTMRFRLNKSTVEGAQTSGYGNTDPTRDPDYPEYWNMGQEIKEILTQARKDARTAAAEAAAPKAAVTCPWCGGTSVPDANGCCQYCGGSLK
jgi:hypothetical protein